MVGTEVSFAMRTIAGYRLEARSFSQRGVHAAAGYLAHYVQRNGLDVAT
jgi:hypothetical protein